jgi:Restriction endonuclease fold toxin 7
MYRLFVAALACAILAASALAGCTTTPRPWYCKSNPEALGGYFGQPDWLADRHYSAMSKGALSDADCTSLTQQFNQATDWAAPYRTYGNAMRAGFTGSTFVNGTGVMVLTNNSLLPPPNLPAYLYYEGTADGSPLVGMGWSSPLRQSPFGSGFGFAGNNDWWSYSPGGLFGYLRNAWFVPGYENFDDVFSSARFGAPPHEQDDLLGVFMQTFQWRETFEECVDGRLLAGGYPQGWREGQEFENPQFLEQVTSTCRAAAVGPSADSVAYTCKFGGFGNCTSAVMQAHGMGADLGGDVAALFCQGAGARSVPSNMTHCDTGAAIDDGVTNFLVIDLPVSIATGVVTRAGLAAFASLTSIEEEVPLYGTALARQLGREGELTVQLQFGVVKNTERIVSLTGTKNFRVPDVLDLSKRIIGEIKNVKSLSYSSQIKDDILYAAQENLQFHLYIRSGTGTTLSGPLKALEAAGKITVHRIL